HADPVVGHGDRPRAGVVADADLKGAVGVGEFGLGEQFQAEPVNGVRAVGDQLAQEYLLVAVQRMHHQVQDLDHFGLEAVALLRAHGWNSTHGALPIGQAVRTRARGRSVRYHPWRGPPASLTGCYGRSRRISAGAWPPRGIRPRAATRTATPGSS